MSINDWLSKEPISCPIGQASHRLIQLIYSAEDKEIVLRIVGKGRDGRRVTTFTSIDEDDIIHFHKQIEDALIEWDSQFG